MGSLKVSLAQKYCKAIKDSKQKYLTADDLSASVGIFPDIISNHLSEFDPIIRLNPDYNLKDILPLLEEYLKSKTPDNKVTKKVIKVQHLKYKSVKDFIFQKFATGSGLIDRSIELSDKDLIDLKKLIISEQKNRKKHK